ncbi:MAG: NAD+ synthase [Dehalococcoidia bacterium]
MPKVDARRLRIAMAQLNTTVGDFEGNLRKMLGALKRAKALGADLLTFPELAVCGYPPEDLLFKPHFIAENQRYLKKLVGASAGITIIAGFADADEAIYNAAAVIHDGRLVDVYHKIFLPNYGVFDENRYFKPGDRCPVYTIAGVNVGVNICEDIWYEDGPAGVQAAAGAELIVNISASPYHFGKGSAREKMIAKQARDNAVIFAYDNLVGGQDELVFDGGSMILDEKGRLLARGRQFEADMILADLDFAAKAQVRREPSSAKSQPWKVTRASLSQKPFNTEKPSIVTQKPEPKSLYAEIYDALVLGTGDYVTKNGFKKVLVGLSGGIDSSLVAAVAVDALGKTGVVGVAMPSRYSSPGSISDAELLAKNLGIKILTVPIEKVFQAYCDTLAGAFKGTRPDVTEENIQARIRGNILMALSNKFGWLVLTTGNKSEMATGYTTLYGDMAGGFAVIKDVPKTIVYELARYCNQRAGKELVPSSVIDKPPSAELRPEQKDSDTLPAYELLDPVLKAYVEEDKSVEEIIATGIDEAVVRKAARLVDGSEYKRRQAPPGIKITTRAFGRDRRLPITNRYKGG